MLSKLGTLASNMANSEDSEPRPSVPSQKSGVAMPAIVQTSHDSEREIVPILPPQPDAEHRFRSGVIAGIVVGLVAFIAPLSILVWLLRRRRCKRTKSQVHELAAKEKEEKSTFVDTLKTVYMPYKHMGTELMSESVHELHKEQIKHQLMSNLVHELPGVVDIEHELPAGGTAFAQK